MSVPNTLADIITKVRRVTGRPSTAQISDADIVKYINTFYLYNMPEHLKMESLRTNYQFLTSANVPVYDMPTDIYLTAMPPVYIGGYQSYMTQSRENFFRINPELNLLQTQVETGTGGTGPFSGSLTQGLNPILQGFKPNPPGAYSVCALAGDPNDIAARFLQWNVLFSTTLAPNATSGITQSMSLIDDGQGNLFAIDDTSTVPTNRKGTINYATGAFSITNFTIAGIAQNIPSGNAINCQYVPYVPSRPQSVVFFQDQFLLYPIPDQAYTVSFEAYKYPFSFSGQNTALTPQLTEWWEMLAYGAADKIFADNADFESMAKFRPLLDEQMRLALRRTIVQQTSERAATIYTEQTQFPQYPFGNLFSGF